MSVAHAALFAERVGAIAAVLEAWLATGPVMPPIGGRGLVVTTGVGSSEAPARRTAALLRRSGCAATFVPISAFATSSAPRGAELVVFSQGLSPNARLALPRGGPPAEGAHPSFERILLFTSVEPGSAVAGDRGLDEAIDAGVEAIVLPPAHEDGILPRVIGPVVASIAAQLAILEGPCRGLADPRHHAIGDAFRAAAAAAPRLDEPTAARPAAIVACADQIEMVFGAANAWLEGLREPPPFSWDVLGLAHGPLQMAHDRPLLALALERATVRGEAQLFDRLERALPAPHCVLRLRSMLPPGLAWIEHEAAVLTFVERELAVRPRDLGWGPGREDAPLYELGDPDAASPPSIGGGGPRSHPPPTRRPAGSSSSSRPTRGAAG
jgi:hypothetical protein